MINELIDGVDADPLPERLYNVKGVVRCFKCGQSLKGQTAYMNMENKLICRDLATEGAPVIAITCQTIQLINKSMKSNGVRLSQSALKKISRAIKESIE